MKNIDFLPDIYRQREALRRARWWWAVVGVLFGAVIGAAATAQAWLRHSLREQFDALAKDYAAAQVQVQELSSLQVQIQRASHEANLYTFLDSSWPKTQILAAVVRPLPETIRLAQIRIMEEEQAKTTVPAAPRPTKADDSAAAKPSLAEADLVRLQEEVERRQTTVEIEGHTADVPRLHEYVGDIHRSPLVASVHIKSLEAASGSHPGPTRFTLRLLVRPGYGVKSSASPTVASGGPPTERRTEGAGG